MGKVTYNGVSSDTLELVIQAPPSYLYPERDIETTHIPGRNGDLIIDNNCYKNISRSCNFGKSLKNSDYVSSSREIVSWLESAKGDYARLEDTYEPLFFYMARYSEGNQLTNYYDQALTITVNFECKPQKFLKTGENQITYAGSIAVSNNPTGYDSLPCVSIHGIQESADVLLMSVINSSNEITSTITLSLIENGNVYIDSEEQNCYEIVDGIKTNINDKVGLNGKSFPTLTKDNTTIKILKYTRDSYDIDNYNKIIASNQTVCKSEYKPKDTLILEKQKKFLIKAYSTIINSYTSTISVNSYQSYASTVSKSYTFESFNKILDSACLQFAIYGGIEDNPSIDGDGNGYIKGIKEDGELKVIATVNGYFITSNDKLIRYFTIGSTITTWKDSSYVTVNYYPTAFDSSNNPILNITYSNLPSWLGFDILYKTTEDDYVTPYKIVFKAKTNGNYWSEKTWIFGKAKWTYQLVDDEIGNLSWSNIKKAFMPTSGITTSTTTTYTYKFLESVIEYENNDYFTTSLNGTKTSGSEALSTIDIKAKKDGYYSYQTTGNSSTRTQWKYLTENQSICSSMNGTDAFSIYYLENKPTYEKEEDWPTWLNPVPVCDDLMNITDESRIKFYIKEKAKYRYSYVYKKEDGTEEERYTEWPDEDYEVGYLMDFEDHIKTVSDSFYICQIDVIPEKYDHDRCFTVGTLSTVTEEDEDGNETEVEKVVYQDPAELSDDFPSFLTATFKEPTEDDEVGEVAYKARTNGYFKWDSNTSWVKKVSGDDLFTSGYKDDTTFYFMSSLPQYPTYYLFTITPEESLGNPDNVKITVKIAGYYRVNSNSDWTYYNQNDILYEATVGESVKIHHLTPTSDSLNYLTIKIIPRWWTL